MLAKRLARRGVFSGRSGRGGVGVGVRGRPACSGASTIKGRDSNYGWRAAATGVISAKVAALTEGVINR